MKIKKYEKKRLAIMIFFPDKDRRNNNVSKRKIYFYKNLSLLRKIIILYYCNPLQHKIAQKLQQYCRDFAAILG